MFAQQERKRRHTDVWLCADEFQFSPHALGTNISDSVTFNAYVVLCINRTGSDGLQIFIFIDVL